MNFLAQHAELVWCIIGCRLVTAIPRVLPVMYLRAEKLPPLLRHWLSFVPVSVMAALLASQIFYYNDKFDPTPGNLYLVAALPSLLVAWKTKSFFGTIIFAMLLVVQALFNMAVAVGLVPVTGQPLPLISKGGTSTIINCAYIGVILSVSHSAKKKDDAEVATAAA